MGVLNKKSQNSDKKDNGNQNTSQQNQKKPTLLVGFSSRKAVFLVTGEVREYKYSYGVPIIPLHGYYYSYKEKKRVSPEEMKDSYVILLISKSIGKEALDSIGSAKVVVMGYTTDQVLIDEPDQEEIQEEKKGGVNNAPKKDQGAPK